MTTFQASGASGLFRYVAVQTNGSGFDDLGGLAINDQKEQKVNVAIELDDKVGIVAEWDGHNNELQRKGELKAKITLIEDCEHTAKLRFRILPDDPQNGGNASVPDAEIEAIWKTNDSITVPIDLLRESANIKDVKMIVERQKADLTWEPVAAEPFSIIRFKLQEWLVKSQGGDETTCYVYFWTDPTVRQKLLWFGCPPKDVNLKEILPVPVPNQEAPNQHTPQNIYAGGMGGKVVPYGHADLLKQYRIGFIQNLMPRGPAGNHFSARIVAEFVGKKMGFVRTEQLNDTGKNAKQERGSLVNEAQVGQPQVPIPLMFTDSPRSPIQRINGKMPLSIVYQTHFTTWLSVVNKETGKATQIVHMEWGLNWKIEKVDQQSDEYHFRNYRVVQTNPPDDKGLTIGSGPTMPIFGLDAPDIKDVIKFEELPP
jgi:hypothetical protein